MNVACPEFDLVQNDYTGPLETTITVGMPIICLLRGAKAVKDIEFSCQRKLC